MKHTSPLLAAVLVLLALASCASNQVRDAVEAHSLAGAELLRGEPSGAEGRTLELELAAARARFAWQDDELSAIYVGRRLAYLGRCREAIAWYEAQIERWPASHRLLRHLGHRLITVRRFDDAIAVLERAQQLALSQPNRLEPDGAPNAEGQPTSTTHGNIDYHLALARYLTGDFEGAANEWATYLERDPSDDSLVAGLHWLYMSLVRSGRPEWAHAVVRRLPQRELDVIENGSYHDLVLLYAGALDLEELRARATDGSSSSAALRYGLARYEIASGDPARGRALLVELATFGAWPEWASFGAIAAEADLARGD